ncbi:MAG: hypothetical protein AAFQ89_22490 [Cyanobacteria bacterium J06626_18]
MTEANPERFPVSQLTQRYNVVRSAIYTRIDALGIKPEKVGNRAFLNVEQLTLMDELHEYIQAGGQTAAFLAEKGLQRSQSVGEPAPVTLTPSAIRELAGAIALELANQMEQAHPLAHLQALEQAHKNGWQLSTSEIADLLDISFEVLHAAEDYFEDAGFVFTPIGRRTNGETAWSVSKPVG